MRSHLFDRSVTHRCYAPISAVMILVLQAFCWIYWFLSQISGLLCCWFQNKWLFGWDLLPLSLSIRSSGRLSQESMFVSPACKSRDCLTVALSLFFWWQYKTWYLWFLLSVEEGKWWLRLWRHAGVLFEEVLWNYLWTAYRLHMACFFHDAQCPNSTIHTLWLQS